MNDGCKDSEKISLKQENRDKKFILGQQDAIFSHLREKYLVNTKIYITFAVKVQTKTSG